MRIKLTLTALLGIFAAALLPLNVHAATTVLLSHNQLDAHPVHHGVVALKEYVEKKTDGRFQIQIYPESSIGDNEDVISQVQENNVQLLVISASTLEGIDKSYGVFSLPYLFSSEAAYEEFLKQPKVFETLSVKTGENKLRPIGLMTAGTRNFYAKYPIHTPDDLMGKHFRILYSDTSVAMMKLLGAIPVSCPFSQVLRLLEVGQIEGAENNEMSLIDQRHGNICKYYSYDGHQMIPDVLLISEPFYQSLSDADKEIFREAGKEAQRVETEVWHQRIGGIIEQAKSIGVNFLEVDTALFRNAVLPLHQQFLESNPNLKELYDLASGLNESIGGK